MSKWILLAGLLVIEFTVIAIGIIVCRKIEEYFGEVLPVYKEMTSCYEKIIYNIEGKFDNLHEVFKAQKALTEEEIKSYYVMTDYIKTLGEQHKELLQCWKGIEDRYSDTYEQFSELNERMQKFQNVIDQIKERIEVEVPQIRIDPNAILDPFYQASEFAQSIGIPKTENPYEIHAKGETKE